MSDQLRELANVGQSVWLDNIRRSMFASGELQRLIDLGLRGMTSNPTIFEKAIGSGSDYDEQLAGLVEQTDPTTVFEALAIRDIRSACDLFRPVWEATKGLDGYVSLEVSPTLAHDTQGTIDAAKRLWGEVDRPNVMIKIPGTAEGMPAIKATIAAGINVNVTLLFSVDRYESAANAYIDGLAERAAKGEPVDRIASVASFFVSRIDTAIDKQLQPRIDKGEHLEQLLGKAAIANTKIAYQRFQKLFGGDRFGALRAKGAHVQRPLWASTSTKNPAYSDLMYVESLVGRDTVNTVPPNTLEALLDHGSVRADTVTADLDAARATIDALAQAQISLYDVTEELVTEGVKSFAASFDAMLAAIQGKLEQLRRGAPAKVVLTAVSDMGGLIDAALDTLAQSDFLRKLWTRDPSPWSSDAAHVEIIKHALGWVEIAQQTHAQSGELPAPARPRLDRPAADQGARREPRHREVALHRRLEIGDDDRARCVLPLLLPARAADRRRQQRRRSFRRDHRSGHEARTGSEGRQVPARLHQRPAQRRALFGALVFRDGPGGARRLRRHGDPRPRDQRDARERGDGRRVRVHRVDRAVEDRRDVVAGERRRDHPEIRERRIAPADVRVVGEDAQELVVLRFLFELRARIGDRDEMIGGVAGADGLLHAQEEVAEERIGLGRRPRFRGDDEERLRDVEALVERLDLLRVGRVEDVQLRVARRPAEGRAQDVGCERAAPHAEHDHVVEALGAGLREIAELAALRVRLLRDLHPPERVLDDLDVGRVARPW